MGAGQDKLWALESRLESTISSRQVMTTSTYNVGTLDLNFDGLYYKVVQIPS